MEAYPEKAGGMGTFDATFGGIPVSCEVNLDAARFIAANAFKVFRAFSALQPTKVRG
jgi:hypothetical protein